MDKDGIKTTRKLAKMTQEQFAAALGVSRISVHHWEKGTYNIPIDILDRLAAAGITAKTPEMLAADQRAAETLASYRKMRSPPNNFTHAYIIKMWRDAGYQLNHAEMLAIAQAYPDIMKGSAQ